MISDENILLIEDLSNGAERFSVPVICTVPKMDTSVFRDFKYAPRLIDVSGHLKNRPVSKKIYSCRCYGSCDVNCQCASGIYTKTGVVNNMDHLMCDIVQECNDYCECALWCGNRIAQKGSNISMEIFARDLKCGWGVRAKMNIPKGVYIGEYTGELIDDDEAAMRSDTTFLFETRIGEQTYTIDAKYCGNYTRFINHSCNPNVKVANVSWDQSENQLIHMCFYTDRIIMKNEEITIDYGDSWWAAKKFACLCGSSKCKYQ
ncbi:unnamed protein product [Caenorhabditis angaria]|uniref:SET domain-containing protein n=1 Tax=Caenorhabditis angaria TaxID=860376 RepID=A0A9P1MVV9_9PELO|nr:unnamed protein product [Caenorhabditis angaria]